MFYPIDYIEPVFRPPSEARALILPVTNGCSWNRCTFCDMYQAPQKKFHPHTIEAIEENLARVAQSGRSVRRIFLADGDAMVLSTRRLLEILGLICRYFPDIERVSCYCLPRNVAKKSVEELQELASLGLTLVYVGCESGDDDVLKIVNKGETFQSSLESLNKLAKANIKRSVMILTGLGGTQRSLQHAYHSALLMNESQPEYVSTLVVSFPLGLQRFKATYPDFVLPNRSGLAHELGAFLSHLNLHDTVFRSDHASNYLVLKGQLGRDKERLLQEIAQALEAPASKAWREEWQRGL